MVKDIKKQLFQRLLVLWLFSSMLVGGSVLYVEFGEVDREVLALGLSRANAIPLDVVSRLGERRVEDIETLQNMVEEFIQGRFVIAEVYGPQQIHLAEAIRGGSRSVDEVLGLRAHRFPLDEVLHYEKFYVEGDLYIQLLVPLVTDGKTHGYFEGVYKVTQAQIDEITRAIYRVLAVVLLAMLATFVILYPTILLLTRKLIKLNNDLFKTNVELMEVMGSAIAKRDRVTDIHNYRVTLYALALAEAVYVPQERMKDLIAGAFLHDVGKIGIEDNILHKSSKLNEEEFLRMKEHVRIGAGIVSKAEWLSGAQEIIEFHHERYDGSGYLQGLKGEDIPEIVRVFAIADVFDALSSSRPYKSAKPLEEVIAMMEQESGKHFDPNMLEVFIPLLPMLHNRIGHAPRVQLVGALEKAVRKYFIQTH